MRLAGPILIPLALGAGCSSRSSTRATSTTSCGTRRPPGSPGSRSSEPSPRSSSASSDADRRSRSGPPSLRRPSSRRCSEEASSTGREPRHARAREALAGPGRGGSSRRRHRERSCTRIPRRASASPPSHPSTSPSRRRATSRTRRRTARTSGRSDARRFFRTGDLAIPRGYGAAYVVVDASRSDLELDLPVAYQDERFTLYRL